MKTRNPRPLAANAPLRVDVDTDRAAFHAMWGSAWPHLRRRCAYLMHGNTDAAADLAMETASTLCAQHARGALRCRDLAALACRLAHLRAIGVWRTKTKRDRQLERLRAHIDTRNGHKVVTSHELAYEGKENGDP